MTIKMLKIPFALKNGAIVHISEVESGLRQDCLCPACKNPLVARKGDLKVHHFAHSAETNCQPETVIHLLGKQLLAEKLTEAIKSNTIFPTVWTCSICGELHVIKNLLQDVTEVRLEHNLGTLRPDLVLMGAAGEVSSIIEIVVSHPPEANVLEYAAVNSVPLFEYHIKTITGLEAIRAVGCLTPSRTAYCPTPKCDKCGKPMSQRKLFVVPGKCWKCGSGMMIAILECEEMMLPTEAMTESEISEAEKRGACLQKNYSRSVKMEYLSNTCPTCGVLTGDNYRDSFRDSASESDACPTGMCCLDCILQQGIDD